MILQKCNKPRRFLFGCLFCACNCSQADSVVSPYFLWGQAKGENSIETTECFHSPFGLNILVSVVNNIIIPDRLVSRFDQRENKNPCNYLAMFRHSQDESSDFLPGLTRSFIALDHTAPLKTTEFTDACGKVLPIFDHIGNFVRSWWSFSAKNP